MDARGFLSSGQGLSSLVAAGGRSFFYFLVTIGTIDTIGTIGTIDTILLKKGRSGDSVLRAVPVPWD